LSDIIRSSLRVIGENYCLLLVQGIVQNSDQTNSQSRELDCLVVEVAVAVAVVVVVVVAVAIAVVVVVVAAVVVIADERSV
jgi:hypothetical protein